jgi:hypothetical protein
LVDKTERSRLQFAASRCDIDRWIEILKEIDKALDLHQEQEA